MKEGRGTGFLKKSGNTMYGKRKEQIFEIKRFKRKVRIKQRKQ